MVERKNVKPHLFNFCLIPRIIHALGWGYTSDLIKILRRQRTQVISRWSISWCLLCYFPWLLSLQQSNLPPLEQTREGTKLWISEYVLTIACKFSLLTDFYQQSLKTHLFKKSIFFWLLQAQALTLDSPATFSYDIWHSIRSMNLFVYLFAAHLPQLQCEFYAGISNCA